MNELKVWRTRLFAGAVACTAVVALTQCDTVATAPKQVVAANLTVATTKATVPALEAQTLSFAGAGAVLATGTAGASFTLALTNTAAATPTATIIIAGATNTNVVSTTTFGSCIFTVTSATGPFAFLFPAGRVITIDPCQITVNAAGQQTGTTSTNPILVKLGTFNSAPLQIPVTISPTGVITIAGTTVGTTTVTNATGAGM